jgi:hypothetical protein
MFFLILVPLQTLNRIIYGHSLSVGSGAGQFRGGLVENLAFGRSDNQGKEYNYYAAHQHNMSGGLFG